MTSLGRCFPTSATSSNRMSPLLVIFTTHRFTVRHDHLGHHFSTLGIHAFQTVRSVPDDVKFQPEPRHQAPFLISGAHNVILETVKRGDDDDVSGSGPKTIVLRLYEAYGGHATVRLMVSTIVGIEKAIVTNLLEDDNEDELEFATAAEEEVSQGYSRFLKLSFRGFEVKTVKLTLGSGVKRYVIRSVAAPS